MSKGDKGRSEKYEQTLFSRHLAHLVFDQLWQQNDASRNKAYSLLTNLVPDYKKGDDGAVHFSKMNARQCRVAVARLIALSNEIPYAEAVVITKKFFESGLERDYFRSIDLSTPELLDVNFSSLQRKFEAQGKITERPSISVMAASAQNQESELSQNKSIALTIKTALEKIFDEGGLNEILFNKEILEWSAEHQEALTSLISNIKYRMSKDESLDAKELLVNGFFDYLDWRYDAQYLNFILSNQGAIKNTTEGKKIDEVPVVISEVPNVAKDPEQQTVQAATGSSKTSKPKPKNDDAALREAMAESKRLQKLFDDAIKSINQLSSLKDFSADAAGASYLMVRENIEKLLKASPDDPNLIFIAGELIRISYPKKSGLGRVVYFDDLVTKILTKRPKLTFVFDSIKKSYPKIISAGSKEEYFELMFYQMIMSGYDVDLMRSFINIFNDKENKSIQNILLGLDSVKPREYGLPTIAASNNPATTLVILEKLEKRSAKDIKLSLFSNPIGEVKFWPISILMRSYDEDPVTADKMIEVFKKSINDIDVPSLANFMDYIIEFAPHHFSEIFKLIGNRQTEFMRFASQNTSCLILAAYHGDLNIISQLLNVAKKDSPFLLAKILERAEKRENHNPLLMAAQQGHAEALSMMLKYLPDDKTRQYFLSLKNREGFTPAGLAAYNGRVQAIKEIAKFTTEDDIILAYRIAANNGRHEILSAILETMPDKQARANFLKKESDGKTYSANIEVMRTRNLETIGAMLNLAEANGVLLEVFSQDSRTSGLTPLTSALILDQESGSSMGNVILKKTKECGVLKNLLLRPNDYNKFRPLNYLVYTDCSTGVIKLLEAAKDIGILKEILATTKDGESPLGCAIICGKMASIDPLLKAARSLGMEMEMLREFGMSSRDEAMSMARENDKVLREELSKHLASFPPSSSPTGLSSTAPVAVATHGNKRG